MSDYNSNHEGASSFGQSPAASAAAGGDRQFDFSAEPEIVLHPSDSETYDRQPHVSHYKAEEDQVCVPLCRLSLLSKLASSLLALFSYWLTNAQMYSMLTTASLRCLQRCCRTTGHCNGAWHILCEVSEPDEPCYWRCWLHR
jgi:hypothetical protein